MQLQEMLKQLGAEGAENLRSAVEIGRWPNGTPLDQPQRALCMQALIAWEQQNLPEQQRSGYMPNAACETNPQEDQLQVIKALE